MDAFPWGSVIGAAGGIASSLFGSSSQKKANQQNLQLAREQLAYQKELAHNQVQWRVEDAQKAGLHPLAALGVSPMSYSPVSGSAVGADYSGVGQSLQQMGQDIDRARMTGLDREERKKALALQDTQTALALKNQELNNQILEQELVSRRVKLFQQLTPGMASLYGLDRKRYAIPGQDDAVMPRVEGTVATGEPMFQFMQQPNGSYSLEPGNDWAQAYEDKLLVEWLPVLETKLRDFYGRVTGNEIDGMVYDPQYAGWVPKDKGKPWYRRFKEFGDKVDAKVGKWLYDKFGWR
nr:MAG TPA: minor capsid protein [Microviridae sp.]